MINGKIHHYVKPKIRRTKEYLKDVLAPFKPDSPVRKPAGVGLEVDFCYPGKPDQYGLYKTTRPDLDNLLKLLQDCMTELGFWEDDSQICNLHCTKQYNDRCGIRFCITKF